MCEAGAHGERKSGVEVRCPRTGVIDDTACRRAEAAGDPPAVVNCRGAPIALAAPAACPAAYVDGDDVSIVPFLRLIRSAVPDF